MPAFIESLQSWHLWGALAIALAAAEMLTVSFFLFCFAVAAVAAAAAAGAGAPATPQFGVFAVGAFLAILGLREPFRRFIYARSEEKPCNSDGMVGLVGTVVDGIESSLNPGRVKLRGEEWRALSEDDAPLEPGQNVTVVAVAGATLRVRAA